MPDPVAGPRSDRLVLVGLPGSGKSTVGSAIARRLGWAFHDVDREIERATGLSIPALFQSEGEAAFRAMESRLTLELCSLPHTVVAPGGGWAAQPGSMQALPASAATIWLRVRPTEAIRRLRGTPEERPLLSGADPLATLEALARLRLSSYEDAHHVVDVDGRTVPEIADAICEWLRPGTL